MLDFKKSEVLILIFIFLINLFFIIYFYNKILQKTENYFTYPLDDTYIHLAMAKNFKNHKVIGINKEFASTTSSPFFTIIISILFLIFGDRADIPLFLNIFLSFVLIFYIFLNLKKFYKPLQSFLLTLFFYFLIPIPTILFLGLEHLLHILFVLIFVESAVSSIYLDKKNYIVLFIFSFLCTATRYESMFLVFPFLLLFLVKKNYKKAISILSGTAIPILIYGLYSLSKGWYFFPNSIILKGYLFNFGSIKKIFLAFGSKVYNEIIMNIYLLPFILLCIFILYRLNKDKDFFKFKVNILSFSLLLNIILHLYFAKTGWLYRYEAYLFAFGFILIINYLNFIGLKANPSYTSRISLIMILLLFIVPIIIRSYNGLKDTSIASKNIYEQQIQMAKFLQKYYKNDWVGVNDIGAVSYFKEKIFDIWGLSDVEVIKNLINHSYSKDFLAEKIKEKNIKVLIIYKNIFEGLGGVPEGLVLAGEWQIKDRKVCAYDTVSFYAMEKDLPHLIKNLREFSSLLPKDVIQSGLYLE